jgi:hypothetical protein
MCATLIGGMDRLKRDYIETAKTSGFKLKVFTGKESKIADRLGRPDLVIVFTNKVSHEARDQVVRFAKTKNIPLRMVHSCGTKDLTTCLHLERLQ